MTEIPDGFLDLMESKALAHLATTMKDGSPQVTPIWFDYTDGKVRVNSAKGRVKSNNMAEGAKVALSIVDLANAYRYVQIRGTVTKVTEVGADAHIDALAKKYLGLDAYPYRDADETRMIFEITPSQVQTMG
jgi:PPOX class probable F420-dependent enzyme